MKIGKALLFGVALSTLSSLAFAGAVITTGSTSLGINDAGHLNFDGLGPDGFLRYGVYRSGVGDAISPGCACEGWGVAITGPEGLRSSGFVNESAGSGGLTAGTWGATSNTFTSRTALEAFNDISIQHAYGPSFAADVFLAQVTITNNSTSTFTDLVYRRVMDWDVPPTSFSEFVTHNGVEQNLVANGGKVLYASNDGFASSNPLVGQSSINGASVNSDFNQLGPDDHGSLFDFALGNLNPGESAVFNIFYGSADNKASAIAALQAIGVADSSGSANPGSLYSLGQSNPEGYGYAGTPDDHPTFIFAFGGIGEVAPGETPNNPILPFVPAPGVFEFPSPIPRRWYDPPASNYEFEMFGGSEWISVEILPEFANVEVWVAGVLKETLTAGNLAYLFDPGVTKFLLKLSSPVPDGEDPTAFPVKLDFTPGATKFTMTAIFDVPGTSTVPEPSTYAMLGAGLAALVAFRRVRG